MWHVDGKRMVLLHRWVGLQSAKVSSIGFPIRLAQPFVLMVAILSAFGFQRLVKDTPVAILPFVTSGIG